MTDEEYNKQQERRCFRCFNYKTCENFMRGAEIHECFEPSYEYLEEISEKYNKIIRGIK